MTLNGVRAEAVRLALTGKSYRQIGALLGVDESSIRRDPDVRRARVKADPNAHSATNRTGTVACRIQPATELIDRVKWALEDLTSDAYTLSDPDRARPLSLLQSGIERLGK